MCFKQLFLAQEGTYDCGLFAVAYATSAAHGQDPAKCTYDQKQIRQHLYRCLCNGKITPFPLKSSSSSSRVITSDNIEVHCHCRMPELKNVAMIQCNYCAVWYHVLCEDVSEDCIANVELEWFCRTCKVIQLSS